LHLGKLYEPIANPSKLEGPELPIRCPSGNIINASEVESPGEVRRVAFIEFSLPAQLSEAVELTLPHVSYYREGLESSPQISVLYKIKRFAEGGGWH
jgi:hypothetical protein